MKNILFAIFLSFISITALAQVQSVNEPYLCRAETVCKMNRDYPKVLLEPGFQRWAVFDANSIVNKRAGLPSDELRKLLESDGKFFTFHSKDVSGVAGFHVFFPGTPWGKLLLYVRGFTRNENFTFSRAIPIDEVLQKSKTGVSLQFDRKSGLQVLGSNKLRIYNVNEGTVKLDLVFSGHLINTRLFRYNLDPVPALALGGTTEQGFIDAPIEWRPTFINADVSGWMDFSSESGKRIKIDILQGDAYFEEMYGVWAIALRSHHYNWLQFSHKENGKRYAVVFGEAPYGKQEGERLFTLNIVTPNGKFAYGRGQYNVEFSDFRETEPLANEWMSDLPFYRIWKITDNWAQSAPGAHSAFNHKAPGRIVIKTFDGKFRISGIVSANESLAFRLPKELGEQVTPWALDESVMKIALKIKDLSKVIRGVGLMQTFSNEFIKK